MAAKFKSRAVVTMAKNESVFLPIWWKYYSQFFKTEDIYILDHETTDGSTSGSGFVRVPVSYPAVDWGWHRDRMQEMQHTLIKKYDVVLCTDADEIVAPDPNTGDLGNYIDKFDDEFVNCAGYEVIHIKDTEELYKSDLKVLQQRSHWFYNPSYSKPLLSTVPMYWHGGLHSRTDGKVNNDNSLRLIHLHRMDYNICHNRHRQRVSGPWNQRDVDENWGYQNRIVDDEKFDRWFYNDSCCETPINIEVIPDYWRDIV